MLLSYFPWLLSFHILSMIAWMAGMLYLPRLYVYHAAAAKGSELSETFKVMERRLLRGIMNPAMISTFLFGGMLIAANPALAQGGWFHAKVLLVLMMAGLHGAFSKWRKVFLHDENTRSPKFYKVWNEMPALLLVFIVILVVVKPF
ncbi:MAG: putative rane protein [Micavibrio sp.]|nr:putative rane protein [Micavibrio sp.]